MTLYNMKNKCLKCWKNQLENHYNTEAIRLFLMWKQNENKVIDWHWIRMKFQYSKTVQKGKSRLFFPFLFSSGLDMLTRAYEIGFFKLSKEKVTNIIDIWIFVRKTHELDRIEVCENGWKVEIEKPNLAEVSGKSKDFSQFQENKYPCFYLTFWHNLISLFRSFSLSIKVAWYDFNLKVNVRGKYIYFSQCLQNFQITFSSI